MKKLASLLAFGILLSCSERQEQDCLSYPSEPGIQGLATPIQFSPDGMAIFNAHDYFMDIYSIDSVVAKYAEVSVFSDTLGFYAIQATEALPMQSFLRVFQGGQAYDIPLQRSRKVTIEIRVKRGLMEEPVNIFGSFNAWNRVADEMKIEGDDLVYTGHFQPGKIEYKFFSNGQEYTDPNAPQQSNGIDGFNSILDVQARGEEPAQLTSYGADESMVYLKTPPASQSLEVLWENIKLPSDYIERGEDTTAIRIPCTALDFERSTLRFFSSNEAGWARELRVPLANGRPVHDASLVKRDDWNSARMYFMMVDRFANGDTTNDAPLNQADVLPQADYMGGDIAGILEKLRSGYFEELGVNTIWLSPITANPRDAWGLWDKGGVKTRFSAYHGYWPISNVRIDNRFGDSAVVQTLLDEAHARGLNVVLDYVANHVHQNHPVYQNHPEWATSLYLPDGTLNTEKWDEHRLTTWFDNHLPTLDLRKREVVEPMTDSALVWVTKFDFDGFRHDATKHIDLLYWRTLTRKVKENVDRPIYQIGETYGSAELIASYLSTGMLNAQFDFNAYDAIVAVLADSTQPLSRVVDVMNASWDWYGQHNTMGYISGNQDRSRFISLASGDVQFDEDQKLAGYTRDIGKPSEEAYQKLILLHFFNHSIPGIPVIYYGDEIGIPGANDPDNRRMMRFVNDLDVDENTVRNAVRAIEQVRSSEMAMLYGSVEIEAVNDNLLLIRRSYLGTTITTYLNRSGVPQPVNAEGEILIGETRDGMLGPYEPLVLKSTL